VLQCHNYTKLGMHIVPYTFCYSDFTDALTTASLISLLTTVTAVTALRFRFHYTNRYSDFVIVPLTTKRERYEL
jgi:hypothetical protein